jgi:hypothetical protein
MKNSKIPIIAVISFVFFSFTSNKFSTDENWYLCSSCCKTKKATFAPWQNGCKVASSGTHNFQFCGKAGDYNYTCQNCDAEVYLTSSSSPSASKCCETGGTHKWVHK